MKKIFFAIPFLLILPVIFYYGCSNSTSVDYPPGIVYGIVIDSATHLPIDSAYVNTIPAGNGCYTDGTGFFRVTGIPMPSSGVIAYVIANKGQYENDTLGLWLLANDSQYVRLVLMPNHGILIRDNFILEQYTGQQSNSSLDLANLTLVQGQNPYRDADLRDSLGLGQRFQFRTAIADPILFSFDTKFAGSLGNFTKSQFDTLKMIYGLNDPISDSYFSNSSTSFIPNPLTENSVYPFYLAGRNTLNPGSPKIYGLLYINSIWTDPGSGNVRMRVDIKENRNGLNYFVTY